MVSLQSPTAPRSAGVNCEVFVTERDACEKLFVGGGSGERARWEFLRITPVIVTLLRGMEVDSHLGGEVEINCDPVLVTGRSQEIRHGGLEEKLFFLSDEKRNVRV